MLIKIQYEENGIIREAITDTLKQLVAIKFVSAKELQIHAAMCHQWPDVSAPMIMGPRSIIQTKPQLIQAFGKEWPMLFHASHVKEGGAIIDPKTGRLLDR